MLRKMHQYLGLFMVLPFIAWAITGVYFFIKPGYSQAYQPLSIKQYPMENLKPVIPQGNWMEYRRFTSIVGEHLIVKTNGKWQQVAIENTNEERQPTKIEMSQLIDDAIKVNPARYGDIVNIAGNVATMSTEVVVTLNWDKMTLSHRGKDNDFIDTMYKIHYLQWSGIKSVDKVLGVLGLVLVLLLAAFGIVLTVKRARIL